MHKLTYLIAIATGFIAFAFGSIVLSVYAALLWLLPLGSYKRKLVCRSVVSFNFRIFLQFIDLIRVIKLDIKDLEINLNEHGSLVIANHPSLIDVLILISFVPRANCVIKEGVWNNPLMAIVVRTCGYIPNTGKANIIDECAEVIENGETLIIFPEGTRTNLEMGYKLARGAAYVALAAEKDVNIIQIKTSTPFLTKEVKWHSVPQERTVFKVRQCPSWEITDLLTEPKSIAVRKLTANWTRFFQEGIS